MTERSSNQTELKIGTSAYNDEDFIRQEAQKYMMYKIGKQKDKSHSNFRKINPFSQEQ